MFTHTTNDRGMHLAEFSQMRRGDRPPQGDWKPPEASHPGCDISIIVTVIITSLYMINTATKSTVAYRSCHHQLNEYSLAVSLLLPSNRRPSLMLVCSKKREQRIAG